MNIIFYILVVVGSIMVYATNMILKQFKQEDNVRAIIGLKVGGLFVALIGILKLLNVY